MFISFFFFSSRRRHTRLQGDWSSDVCSSDLHRERNDGVLEAEDLRILAVALGLAGRMRDAEEMLRAVIARATKHDRPLLVASAQRDLASLLHRIGDRPAATVMAQAARVTFDRLGATAEIAKLDALDATMASSSRRAQP